ncbi:hypothetical protein Taro_028519 [Colocasia esculenta]|uniref:Uncharacterized protein n=1 Tax=Colocasia esculenta TaxID=4460 RepID=A0A843VHG5_COLES|nr:hypothetical protein [Colocasia esculenta]
MAFFFPPSTRIAPASAHLFSTPGSPAQQSTSSAPSPDALLAIQPSPAACATSAHHATSALLHHTARTCPASSGRTIPSPPSHLIRCTPELRTGSASHDRLPPSPNSTHRHCTAAYELRRTAPAPLHSRSGPCSHMPSRHQLLRMPAQLARGPPPQPSHAHTKDRPDPKPPPTPEPYARAAPPLLVHLGAGRPAPSCASPSLLVLQPHVPGSPSAAHPPGLPSAISSYRRAPPQLRHRTASLQPDPAAAHSSWAAMPPSHSSCAIFVKLLTDEAEDYNKNEKNG